MIFNLKESYKGDYLENFIYKDDAILAMIRKDSGDFGRYIRSPMVTGPGGGGSNDFGTALALANETDVTGDAWNLTAISDHKLATIDNMLLESATSQKGYFLKTSQLIIESTLQVLKNRAARALVTGGWGDIARVGSIDGNKITLKNLDDVHKVERGQRHQFSATQSSSVLRGTGGFLRVTKVNRGTGVVEYGADVSTVTGVAADDFVFLAGDREGSALPKFRQIVGFSSWLPAEDPQPGDNFFGVDRSVDPTRYAGLRYRPGALPLRQALSRAATMVASEGGKVDVFLLNPINYNDLENALSTQVIYEPAKVGVLSFPGIKLATSAGIVNVQANVNVPLNTVFGLDVSTWTLHTSPGFIKETGNDTLDALRQANADGIELRYGYYAQLGCSAPGRNIRITLDSNG